MLLYARLIKQKEFIMTTPVRLVSSTQYVTNEGTQTDPISTEEAAKCIARNALEAAKQFALHWILPSVTVGTIAGIAVAFSSKEDSINSAKNAFCIGSVATLSAQIIAKIASSYINRAPQ